MTWRASRSKPPFSERSSLVMGSTETPAGEKLARAALVVNQSAAVIQVHRAVVVDAKARASEKDVWNAGAILAGLNAWVELERAEVVAQMSVVEL